jgi:hypothetical protein
MRVARLLVYEGDEKTLEKQLAESKHDGRHSLHGGAASLRVITLPSSVMLLLDEMAQLAGGLCG